MSMPVAPDVHTSARDTGFDAYLGDARNRYLGEGFRRVETHLSDLVAVDEHTVRSIARVAYPQNWSLKGGVARAPHLSTVDAIRVANDVRLSLMRQQLPWLGDYGYERSLTVRAGARPCTDLDAVPVESEISQPDADTVRLRHTIGTLKVDAEWTRMDQPLLIDDAWGAGSATNVRLTTDARVSCFYERRTASLSVVSFLEVMMLAAQMSQVALYEGDAERRARSGNMWMRRAGFIRHTPTPQRSASVGLELRNRREIAVGGHPVDTADVVADDMFGVQVTASLATGA